MFRLLSVLSSLLQIQHFSQYMSQLATESIGGHIESPSFKDCLSIHQPLFVSPEDWSGIMRSLVGLLQELLKRRYTFLQGVCNLAVSAKMISSGLLTRLSKCYGDYMLDLFQIFWWSVPSSQLHMCPSGLRSSKSFRFKRRLIMTRKCEVRFVQGPLKIFHIYRTVHQHIGSRNVGNLAPMKRGMTRWRQSRSLSSTIADTLVSAEFEKSCWKIIDYRDFRWWEITVRLFPRLYWITDWPSYKAKFTSVKQSLHFSHLLDKPRNRTFL